MIHAAAALQLHCCGLACHPLEWVNVLKEVPKPSICILQAVKNWSCGRFWKPG